MCVCVQHVAAPAALITVSLVSDWMLLPLLGDSSVLIVLADAADVAEASIQFYLKCQIKTVLSQDT